MWMFHGQRSLVISPRRCNLASMQKTALIDIELLKENPDNPRTITDTKFQQLVKSVKDFPQMLEVRPIAFKTGYVVLGGNMRLRACKAAGLKQVPAIDCSEMTEAQQREFVIKDNVGFGDWDWQVIQADWPEAEEWGLEVPGVLEMPSDDELIREDKNKPPIMKITFESPEQLQQAENDIQELIDRKYKGAFYSVSAGEL